MDDKDKKEETQPAEPTSNPIKVASALVDASSEILGGILSFQKISKTTSVFLVSTALFFDFLQLILQPIAFLGQALAMGVDIFAFLTFGLWFLLIGVSFVRPSRLIGIVGTFLIELIPILDALPAWTFYIFIMIILENSGVGAKASTKLIPKL
ncbi:MAG: hypothetical protein WA051_00700 [Minisyncoccia bacterium]